MAEENDLPRTEPASAKRLQDARRAGDVPRSAEWSAWIGLLAGLAALYGLAPRLFDALTTLTRVALQQAAQPGFILNADSTLRTALAAALWASLPLLALIFIAALLAPLLLSGWTAAPAATQMHWTRANPLKALVRLFSVDGWFDGTLALIKLALTLGVLAWFAWPAALFDTQPGLLRTTAWLGQALIALVAALALAAVLDAGYRWWRYLRRHAMTWQEVRAEVRESEVDPEVRARLRGRQQQLGKRGDASRRAVDEVIG